MDISTVVKKLTCTFMLILLSTAAATSSKSASDIVVEGACSLHDAIKAANSDTAVGGCPAGNGYDVIALTGDVELPGMLPPISSDMSIQGSGHALRGGGRDRILRVVAKGLAIHQLTLTAGRRQSDAGGAIRVENGASLQVYDSAFVDNEAKNGGAIANYGSLGIDNTTFIDNRATVDGGAIHNEGETLIITNSVFENNSAGVDGGAVDIHEGNIDIRHSRFSHNQADTSGGGISAHSANLRIKGSTLDQNRARLGGGAIDISGSTLNLIKSSLRNNSSADQGGAIRSFQDIVSIRESLISGNTAEREGGGIYGQAKQLTIHGSIISDNSGSSGGGFFTNRGLNTITASTFSGNSADWNGGAINSRAEQLKIRNSTFYGNRAAQTGGGLYLEQTSSLAHLTIVHNFAAEAGGIHTRDGEVQLVNSIVAGNRSEDCSGTPTLNINNLIEDGSCDPWLEGDPVILGAWGSPATLVLAPASPAVDAGNPAFCALADQSGWTRGKDCDLGAFEYFPGRNTPFQELPGSRASEPRQDPSAGIVVNKRCTLAHAIASANSNFPYGDCPAGYPGADKITLTSDMVLNEELPWITSEITIEGAGYTISGDDEFQIFRVSFGLLTLNDLRITEANSYRGGGAISGREATIILNRSIISGNSVEGDILADGGGIFCFPCTLIINDSLISGNSTEQSGGGIAFVGLSETNYLKISNSVIDGNSARHGGGLYVSGPDSLERMTITNSVISNNFATKNGGGINASVGSEHSTLSIDRSTINGNRAGDSGGALFTAENGRSRLTNVTIVANRASSGGGIYTQDPGSTHLRFSILAGNIGNDCVGYPEQNIGNIIADGTCDPRFTGDPMLAKLVEPEDGSLPYFPLLPGSPAIDAAFDAYCGGPDQIGTPLPQGAACDIGAVEFVPEAGAASD